MSEEKSNEVPPKWRMPNGHVFATGDMLRAHLNAGGFVQIVDREKWYRSRANKQEWLGEKSWQWEQSAWDWNDLARMNVCRACDEPQLSKDIRAREEADAERSKAPRVLLFNGPYVQDRKRVEDSERAPDRVFGGTFAEAWDAMEVGACLTLKGEKPRRYYIVDVWGQLKAHDGSGIWLMSYLSRAMMRGVWEFFSHDIPYGPIEKENGK